MYSKVKIGNHPVHPMLVAFPIAFYTLTFVAFLVYQYFSKDVFWFRLGFFANYVGVFSALLAAIPGFIDWLVGIPKKSAAKRRGLIHMALNLGALIVFGVNAISLAGTWQNPPIDVSSFFVLSLIGFVLTGAAGYHGWNMVATHKVGVNLTPQQERLEPVEKMKPREHQIDSRTQTVNV